MSSVTVGVPHGILFILDPNDEDALVPEYNDDELVSATDSCISVAVQPEVDGDVEISMSYSDMAPPELTRVASKEINVKHGTVACITAGFDSILFEYSVPECRVTWVDDAKAPSRVMVNVLPFLST